METPSRAPDAELQQRPDPASFTEKAHHDEASRRTSLKPGQTPVISAAEKRLIRKLDMHLIPLVMMLYLFSFLDRCVPPSLPGLVGA